MRLDVIHRLKLSASPATHLRRHAWKYGVGAAIATLALTAGGVERVQPHPHALATTVLPTNLPCGPIATDAGDPHTATWTAVSSPYGTGSTYNLPVNATNNSDPTVQPCAAIIVPADVTLRIDTSQGPVHVSSHGAAISVQGGHLLVLGTSETNSVLFDAEPDVSSWDGISVTASDPAHRGNASMAYASIQNALNSITISSGATSTPDPTNLTAQLPYGLTLVNTGVGPSIFDGIDVTDTPVTVRGRTDPVTHRADGRFGTVNNIGSQGIKLTFDAAAPALTANALDIESVTFGSSVPFATTGCLPLQPCAAGFIGNDAVLATFAAPSPPPVSINQSRFFRAGSFGVELNGANRPVIKDNNFDCNGTSSATPRNTCVGTGLKFSAIYLNAAIVDLENSVTNNVGHEDGLDAIVLNGTIVYASGISPQVLTWKNATNDPAVDHLLGYLLNGDLNLTSGTLVVPGGGVVKSKGTINLAGAALDASAPAAKIFTSLRDNVNIPSCPSVFVQSCPSPLPAGEWGGINLIGSGTDATIRSATKGTITNASILYANTGVHILNGNSLTISGSAIGPSFADGVLAEGTAIAVTGTTFGCPAGVCSGAGNGNHGIMADFRNVGPLTGGLKVGGLNPADGNTFQGSINEAIRGVGLTGQTVDIENNAIAKAGATGSAGSAGIYLQGADNLTLQQNSVVFSGTGNAQFPAIWLDGVSHADFRGPISGNSGSGNGLNAIAFHGDSKAIAWQTVAASGPLGFIVDGNLLVAGDLTLVSGDYAPVVSGTITVQGGTLTSAGAVMTSLKAQTLLLPSCGSIFVPKLSGVCPPASAGDWGGLVLDPGRANQLTDSAVRYAVTGISMSTPTGFRLTENLTLTRTSISNTAADGVSTRSPLSVTGGAFSNNGGRAIRIDLTGVAPSAFQPLTITGPTSISGSGQDGILALGLGGETVQVQSVSVDHAGAYGINLKDADHLTLTNNTVTNAAASFAAIYLNGLTGPFANISGNRGALNGLDALAFHGTITDDLTWRTARQGSDPTQLLGYILDNTLTMQASHTLTINAGDIVKVGNGGMLNLQGVNLKADDTGSGSQKVFTSLTDDSVGIATCHSALTTGCTGAAAAGDWGGISLNGSGANGTLVNGAVRYAATGIVIASGAASTFGSSVFGLVVSGSSIGPSAVDGINAAKTALSVTGSTLSGGTHGVSVDLTGAAANTALRLSGDRFISTSAEAILGQALAGQPVWITDSRIQGAATFGIRLLNADQLVLRNNIVAGSGGGPGAGAGRYPAIYLPAVSADFVQNIRGNAGSGNGLDALVLDGKVTSDLTWVTPSNAGSTHPFGYLLDGGLTLQGGKLTVAQGDVVKSLGGPITINGGTISATGAPTGGSPTSRSAIFTSLKDNPSVPASPVDVSDAAAVSCPSVLVPVCSPGQGDWGGLAITNNAAGLKGSGAISYGLINYANTGISLDSGPISASPELSNFRLTVANTTIANASKDAINSLDTPFSVDSSTVQNAGANGVIASFFSPANCPSTPGPCVRLNLTNTQVMTTGKDGIIANGLSGQPTVISANSVTDAGTYGIRLVGADQLTLTTNHVRKSAPPPAAALRYAAIYLNSVKTDFEVSPAVGSIIQGNSGKWTGLDAIVFHGEALKKLTWITAVASTVADVTFGYLLDGALVVDGDLVTNGGDIVKIINGGVKINGGSLQSVGTTFTSLRDNVGLPVCHSIFIPEACPAVPTASDWSGINIDAADSVFNNGKLLYASSGVTINSATLKVKSTLITGLLGYAVTTTGTASAQVDCASIHGNGGGISANGASTTAVTYSNLFGNNSAGKDFNATVAASAANDWWGQAIPVASQSSGSVTVATPLPQEAPTFKLGAGTIATASTNTNNASGKFGNGTFTVTLTADREVDPTVPLSVTFLGPAETVPHLVTGTWMGDNLTWVGTTSIDPLTDVAGLNTLTISGAKSCIPDGNNVMTPETATFTLDFGKATVPGPGSAQNVGGKSATFNESVNPNGWSIQKDTYAFFQYRLDVGAYDASVIAAIQAGTLNPTTLLGYQTIGHLSAPVPVAAQVSQLLTPATLYDYRVVAVDLNGITTGPDHQFTTLAAATHFDVTGVASTTAGGTYNLIVTARNATTTVIDYSGTVGFSSSDLQWIAPSPGTLTNGTGSFIATLKTAGSQSITASDGLITGQLTPITVNAAAAKTLSLTPQAGTLTHGVPFSLAVTAKDAYGNTATGYTGTVHFTSSDSAATLPADYTFTTGTGNDNGLHSFSVTLSIAGTFTLTAKDTVTATITGTATVTAI